MSTNHFEYQVDRFVSREYISGSRSYIYHDILCFLSLGGEDGGGLQVEVDVKF